MDNPIEPTNTKHAATGILHGVAAVILFAIPFIVTSFPQWTDITIGGVLTAVAAFVKAKYW